MIMSIQHYGFLQTRLSFLRLGKNFSLLLSILISVDNPDFIWTASPPDALSINDSGFATATSDGEATVQVSVVTVLGNTISAKTSFTISRAVAVITETTTVSDTSTSTTDTDSTPTVDDDVVVTAPQSYQGTIQTTSSYKLTGSYEYGLNDAGQLVLDIAGNYEASTALPGLYVYLSNNPNSTSVFYEIAEVTVFNGAHSYTLPSSIDISDYKYILYWCKPFNVKVDDSTIF